MKTAVITGASSGMGREFAKQISEKYKNIEEIWVIARREDKLNRLKEEIQNKRLYVLPLDLTVEEDLKRYADLLKERKPDICILVNSAGYGRTGSFEEVGYEQNRGMIKLNCQALTDVTYLTLPYMRKGSQLIQLASSAAFLPQPYFAVYAATKSYVLSLSRGLKRELSHRKIRVTAVCPGPVDTEFFDFTKEKDSKNQISDQSLVNKVKQFVMAKPEKVVKKALKDSRRGREKSVYGLLIQLFEAACKLLPHRIILKFM